MPEKILVIYNEQVIMICSAGKAGVFRHSGLSGIFLRFQKDSRRTSFAGMTVVIERVYL